jgi:hypothetical protein
MATANAMTKNNSGEPLHKARRCFVSNFEDVTVFLSLPATRFVSRSNLISVTHHFVMP